MACRLAQGVPTNPDQHDYGYFGDWLVQFNLLQRPSSPRWREPVTPLPQSLQLPASQNVSAFVRGYRMARNRCLRGRVLFDFGGNDLQSIILACDPNLAEVISCSVFVKGYARLGMWVRRVSRNDVEESRVRSTLALDQQQRVIVPLWLGDGVGAGRHLSVSCVKRKRNCEIDAVDDLRHRRNRE